MNLTLIRIATIGALAIALVFGLLGLGDEQVEKVIAEEKTESVHIIPARINSEDWENIESARIQDMSEDSIFNDFNTINSAYVVSEEYKSTHYSEDSPSSGSFPLPESSATADAGPSPEAVAESLSEIPDTSSESEPTPTVNTEPSPEVVVEITPEPQPEADQSPIETSESNPGPPPEATVESTPEATADAGPPSEAVVEPEPVSAPEPVSEPAEPSAFYRFLENSIFPEALAAPATRGQAWAQETDAVSNSYDIFSSCDDENIQCLSKDIEFSGFGIADTLIEKPIRNIQLRLSLAGVKEDVQDAQSPGRILIEYFYRDTWSRAGEILITDEISNSLNGGYFLYALPEFKSWEELDDFRVKISAQYFGDSEMNIFLDGLWLEADADFGDLDVLAEEPIEEELDLELVSASSSFSSSEIPQFSFNYKREGGVFDLLSAFFMSLIGRGGVELSVIDQKTDVGPKINTDGENFKVEFQNSRFFVPGRHRLRIGIYDNGKEYRQEQEFLWGALFVNMKKTSYVPGEVVRFYVEVLDDLGNPSCDARVQAEIKSYLGRVSTFSTEKGNIYYSGKCLDKGSESLSSFYLQYEIPPETGTSRINLSVETSSGSRNLSANFEVVDFNQVEIIRDAPINIVPGREYEVSLVVKSNNDIDGIFREIVPANFEIIPSVDQDSPISIQEDGYSRVISWPVSLKAGESSTIEYSFRALNSSLAMYVVGPASLESFREPRSWLMVSSGGNSPLMLNNNSAHSCDVEPFSQKVSAGNSIRYDINLTSSEINKPFLIGFPSLPSEVVVSLNRGTGTSEDIYADIFVQPDAPRGSFNLVMVYQEREDNGAILGTSCQFNIVVE